MGAVRTNSVNRASGKKASCRPEHRIAERVRTQTPRQANDSADRSHEAGADNARRAGDAHKVTHPLTLKHSASRKTKNSSHTRNPLELTRFTAVRTKRTDETARISPHLAFPPPPPTKRLVQCSINSVPVRRSHFQNRAYSEKCNKNCPPAFGRLEKGAASHDAAPRGFGWVPSERIP